MTRARTQSNFFKHFLADELRAYPVLVQIVDVLPDDVLFGDDETFSAAMVAKYGDDWENAND